METEEPLAPHQVFRNMLFAVDVSLFQLFIGVFIHNIYKHRIFNS